MSVTTNEMNLYSVRQRWFIGNVTMYLQKQKIHKGSNTMVKSQENPHNNKIPAGRKPESF